MPSMNGRGPDTEDDGAMPAAVNMDGYYTSLLGRVQEVGVTSEWRGTSGGGGACGGSVQFSASFIQLVRILRPFLVVKYS